MLKFSEEILSRKYNLNHLRCRVNFLHFTFNLNQTNYYDILGVPRGASQKEIKEKYLKLCKIYHPDISIDSNLSKDEKVKKFQKINEAYQCLSKVSTKMAYDQSSSQSNPQHPFNNPYNNPYTTGRTRAYPRRTDGYRPYGQSYGQSFKSKDFYYDPFEDKERPKRPPPDFREFDEFFNTKPTPQDLKSVSMFMGVISAIVIYIIVVRIYVIFTYKNQRDRNIFDFDKINNNENERVVKYDQKTGRYVDLNDDVALKGYQFTKGEKFEGKEDIYKDPLYGPRF